MQDGVLVIHVGAEGGDWKLVGRQTPQGSWQFQTRLNDQSYVLLDGENGPGAAIRRDSEWFDDWRLAMLAFGHYPWESLHPVEVHPGFREKVWDALTCRSSLLRDAHGQRQCLKWARACGRNEAAASRLAQGPDVEGIPLYQPGGSLITCLDEWTHPKKEWQWKDNRSAKELARAWLADGRGICPCVLREMLDSRKSTQGIRLLEAWPESVTSLPSRGEGRNHDLRIRAEQYGTPVTICVEAKADEPFGSDTIGVYVRSASTRVSEDGSLIPSGVPARARALLKLLFSGEPNPTKEPYSMLRYQLLTALAGTCLQAGLDGSPVAIFVVHEILSSGLDQEKLDRNASDLEYAIKLFSKDSKPVPGRLVGPFLVRSSLDDTCKPNMKLYVGKIVTYLDKAGDG